jgi:hypothetical protein
LLFKIAVWPCWLSQGAASEFWIRPSAVGLFLEGLRQGSGPAASVRVFCLGGLVVEVGVLYPYFVFLPSSIYLTELMLLISKKKIVCLSFPCHDEMAAMNECCWMQFSRHGMKWQRLALTNERTLDCAMLQTFALHSSKKWNWVPWNTFLH